LVRKERNVHPYLVVLTEVVVRLIVRIKLMVRVQLRAPRLF